MLLTMHLKRELKETIVHRSRAIDHHGDASKKRIERYHAATLTLRSLSDDASKKRIERILLTL